VSEAAKIRALIVDDEPDARLQVRGLLAAYADVEVVGECSNGYEAIDAVAAHAPDLMFLDEKMPELDGFGVLERIDPASRPLVVFVTAHTEFAVRAFDVEPVHYLLKPLDEERFDEAMRRVKDRLAARRAGGETQPKPAPSYLENILITEGGRSLIIKVGEVDWIKAWGKYSVIQGAHKWPMMTKQISDLEAELDPRVFVRIHRSFIVKFDLIAEVQYVSKHKSWVVLRDGTRLPMSETGHRKLAARLGNNL
jgi:two-component system, LytTR family, response regulator